jgi:hypothetical protein
MSRKCAVLGEPTAAELFRPISTAACRASASGSGDQALFDHLVGGREQRLWNFEAQRLGGFEVDHQLELGRL